MPDKNDKMKFECECQGEYYGEKCEKKTGCHKNLFGKDPCKHGTCSNDAEDMSTYHCKCEDNYVGKDCDIKDACLTNNPCVKGSVCTLDDNFKPKCECQIGFKGKKCDERDCPITRFKGKNFLSKDNIYVDQKLIPNYEKLDGLADLCGVKVEVTQSFTKLVKPTDLVKNNYAMFFTGHGLRFEISDGKKIICDEKCLGMNPIGDKKAACFINGLNAIDWKYSTWLAGVLHDGSHINNFGDYNTMKQATQVGCQQDKSFPVVKGRDHLTVDLTPNNGATCPKGLAGENCDKDDLCVKKNPCAKGSECTLDEKLKPVCACPNGFTGTKCDKRNCTIEAFTGKRFGGHWYSHTKVYISKDLHNSFDKLDDLAKLCKVNFDLKNSFMKNNNPNYKIDWKAPMYVGYGIVVELLDEKEKLLCNSVCLAKSPTPIPAAKCLIDGLEAIGFKHNPKYPGLIYHESLLSKNNNQYNKLREFKQVGCEQEKFYKKL